MPIYEYRCAACGHELEALQKLSDAPLTVCPSCQQAELKKLVSAAGFQLKGSGWYVTDFRNSGAKPPAKERPASGEAASSDNGSATAASANDASAGDTKKAETKTTEKAATSTTTESKPAATTASTTKSDT
jgi:putative FmdB family regulatory protein